jgi:uncharacterized membrane protein (UPF0127 family)
MSVAGQRRSRALRFGSALALLFMLPQCRGSVGGEAQAAPPTAARPESTERAKRSDAVEQPLVVLEPLGGAPVRVKVELAQTPQERQRGLMYRKQLAPDAGMLFIFEREQPNSFWMRNTYLPLDLIFIKADWSVLGIVENATPLTDSPRQVPGESQYVLEVNAGFSRQYGIASGTKVRFISTGTRQGS